MKTIRCINMKGEEVEVDVDALQYRPAAYVFIVHEGKVLTFSQGESKTLMIPGGKIERGETAVEALLRETQEEVGMVIENIEPLCFAEAFLFAEHKQQAYQAYSFFFTASPRIAAGQVVIEPAAEVQHPEWIELTALQPTAFHRTATQAVNLFLQRYHHV